MQVVERQETEVQRECRERNEEASRKEVQAWMDNPPKKYFAYIQETGKDVSFYWEVRRGDRLGSCVPPKVGKLTTWMGDVLGTCIFGRPWKSNFGDTRVPVWVTGTNGKKYFGTFYMDAGDYARIRQVK